MKPTEFEEQNVVFAKDQPEYQPLPAHKALNDTRGTVVSCWELSPEEIELINQTGKVYVSQLTFNQPLQPLFVAVDKYEIFEKK